MLLRISAPLHVKRADPMSNATPERVLVHAPYRRDAAMICQSRRGQELQPPVTQAFNSFVALSARTRVQHSSATNPEPNERYGAGGGTEPAACMV